MIAKLAATTAVYAWGGAAGIFSPTLFFGAAIGLVFTDFCGLVLHLQVNDRIALTVAGMSACLGAVVRAPINSILSVFEMTHQFSFVPLLMIGTIASQAVSRAFCGFTLVGENFWQPRLSKPAVLTRDELKRQERESIATALKQTGGKVFGPRGAAELLGMKPQPLLRASLL